jgi:protocatechuate 3,4-dioxygenase beta subunit
MVGVLAVIALLAGQQTVVVRGVVTDDVTRQPIAGASVVLVRADSMSSAIVVSTDARGQFVFEKVQPAAYRLHAEQDAYVRSDVATTLDVAADRSSSDLSLTLVPSAVISGRVTDEFGEPAARVYVRASIKTVVAETRTNDLGEYRLFGLRPDAYVISAERYPGPSIDGTFVRTPTPPCPDCRGEGTMSQPLRSIFASGAFIDPRALTGQTYPPVFYPGTIDRAAATPVKTAPGARIDGIDLTLVVK